MGEEELVFQVGGLSDMMNAPPDAARETTPRPKTSGRCRSGGGEPVLLRGHFHRQRVYGPDICGEKKDQQVRHLHGGLGLGSRSSRKQEGGRKERERERERERESEVP